MGTPPTGYVPKYKLWYIELNQFSHHSMCLYLPPLHVVTSINTQSSYLHISISTQYGSLFHHFNVVISITTQCGYLYHHPMWLQYLHHHSMWLSLSPLNVVTVSPSPLNVVISITTQCGYLYHHLMWLSLSPLNVVISITT